MIRHLPQYVQIFTVMKPLMHAFRDFRSDTVDVLPLLNGNPWKMMCDIAQRPYLFPRYPLYVFCYEYSRFLPYVRDPQCEQKFFKRHVFAFFDRRNKVFG